MKYKPLGYHWLALTASMLLAAPSSLEALELDVGQHIASAQLGLSPMGDFSPARLQLMLLAEYEYLLLPELSPLLSLSYGFNWGSTDSLLIGLGARYRYQDLPWPVHVHASLSLLGGGLLNVRNVNLPFIGARAGVGANYFFTSKLGAGAQLTYEGGATLASRNAYHWQLGILLGVSYIL